MTTITGGAHTCTGRSMRPAHRKPVATQGLDDAHLDHVVEHLGATFTGLGVVPHLVKGVAHAAELMRGDVFDREPRRPASRGEMRLTKATDYALRVLLYAAIHPERRVSTDEIARAFEVSKDHLGKVVNQLGHLGWIDARRGRGGGLMLARAPEVISLGEVARAIEPDLDLVECFDRRRNTCPIVPACGLIKPFAEARRAFLAVLDSYTLADMVPGAGSPQRDQLITLLGV